MKSLKRLQIAYNRSRDVSSQLPLDPEIIKETDKIKMEPLIAPPSLPAFSPMPLPPPGRSDPLYKAWMEVTISGMKHIDEMFQNILRKFTIPFWLSVAMNVVVFIIGATAFSVAMIYSLLKGQSEYSVVFGALDVSTVYAYFVSTPIKKLERDVGFITWIGLVYTTYWVGLTDSFDEKTFQTDMERITKNATSSIAELLDKEKSLDETTTKTSNGPATDSKDKTQGNTKSN